MWKDERICSNKELAKATKRRKTLVIPQLTDNEDKVIQDAVYVWEVYIEESSDKE